MIVLTTTGCMGSPSVAMSTSGCPWTVSCAGHTDANELIILNRYLRPGVMVNVSSGVFVLNPVLGSCERETVRKTEIISYPSSPSPPPISVTVNCPLPLISNDSGSCPVFAANRPGNLSIAFSCSQSDNSITCVVRS